LTLKIEFLHGPAASGLPGVAPFDAESELQYLSSSLEELMTRAEVSKEGTVTQLT